MSHDFLHTYRFELSCSAIGVFLLAVGFGAKISPVAAAGACVVGVAIGACIHRRMNASEIDQKDEQISELLQRPTRDSFDALRSDLLGSREEVASVRAAMTDVSGELLEAQAACRKLAGELQRLQVTSDLAQFSDFQLLAMADVCDAEDVRGYLVRPLNDPAMEQLRALGIVTFDSSQDGSKDLKWVLVPEWRQAVRARRMQIDERTRVLRERRGDAIQGSNVGEESR